MHYYADKYVNKYIPEIAKTAMKKSKRHNTSIMGPKHWNI